MKKLFLGVALSVFIISSCKKNNEVVIQIQSDSIINQMQGGIGVNFTNLTDSMPVVDLANQYRSYGGSTWGANPPLSDTAAWNKIFGYADWMAPDFCRLLISMHEYQSEKGEFTFDNYSMQMIYNYLDYCQSRGIDVFLQHLWINAKWLSVPEAGNDPVRILRSAPNNIEDYTESMVKLIEHLIYTKKYTCIKYICIINEPFENWSWYIGSFNPDKFISPEPAYALMKEKIIKKSLPIKLSGPDVSVYYSSKIHPLHSSFFKYFDAYDVHSYVTRYDWNADSVMIFEDGSKGELNTISLTEKQYAEWKNHGKMNGNKPFFITEMGSFGYGFGEDTIGMSTYDALLKDVESVVRYSNVGVDGFMRWSFLNRGNLDGHWQFVNTWNVEKNSFLPADSIQPQPIPFYTWGLLSRYVPKNAIVLKTSVSEAKEDNVQRIFSTMYKDPNSDNFTLVIVNDGDSSYKSKLNFSHKINSEVEKLQVVPSNFGIKRSDDDFYTSEKINIDETILLPAKSITIVTSYFLKNNEKGIF